MFQAIVLMKFVLIFVFLLLHLSGDPARIMLPDDATEEDIAELRNEMGLDKPLLTQYLIFFRNVLHGNFGESFEHGESALKVVLEHLPATIELASAAFIMSVIIGLPFGCIAALKENTVYDKSLMFGAVLGQAVPDFWLGLMMILFFSVKLGWLPPFGYGEPVHFIMPTIAAGVFHTARLARLMRSEMLEVLRQDYVRTARAKGVSGRIVVLRHALRNAMIPLITLIGLVFADGVAGSVIVEQIFGLPGMGRLLVDSIFANDLPVVQLWMLFFGTAFVLINLAVDLSYAVFDPRIRFQ